MARPEKQAGQLHLRGLAWWIYASKRRRSQAPGSSSREQLVLFPDPPPEQLQLAAVDLGGVVVVECRREGRRNKVRVFPVSQAFKPLHCQFPRALRQAGARYEVGGLHLVEQPGRTPFYRVAGEIRPLPRT